MLPILSEGSLPGNQSIDHIHAYILRLRFIIRYIISTTPTTTPLTTTTTTTSGTHI